MIAIFSAVRCHFGIVLNCIFLMAFFSCIYLLANCTPESCLLISVAHIIKFLKLSFHLWKRILNTHENGFSVVKHIDMHSQRKTLFSETSVIIAQNGYFTDTCSIYSNVLVFIHLICSKVCSWQKKLLLNITGKKDQENFKTMDEIII